MGEPQPCQHCLDPIVAARVYEESAYERMDRTKTDLELPRAYRVIWVREDDRRPYCWIPCSAEADGHHWLPHKPMPTV